MRQSFSVFVSSPDSIENSRGSRVNFFICSKLGRPFCSRSMRCEIMSRMSLLRISSSVFSYLIFLRRAYSFSASNAGMMMAVTYLRLSPMTATCSMNRSVPRRLSIACGAIYFPFEVLKRSLMRSVSMISPSAVIFHASPVLSHPSDVKASAVYLGLLR